ncbi:MAG: DUF2845 domain-containing protein [Pseudomonadota bacterium]|jgi:hypothetical protein
MNRTLAALLLLCAAAEAQALRCDGRVVDVGDHAIQVRERCGEPFWIDAYTEVLVQGEYGPLEQRVERPVEAWYYNFGPNRLLRRLLLVDDRLLREDSLGYGVAAIGADCRLDALPVGTPAGALVARCGEPASRRDRWREIIRRDSAGNAHRRFVRDEDWVYDLGASRDRRLLRLVDGVLQGVERLDR